MKNVPKSQKKYCNQKMQLPLENSKIKLVLKELDELEDEQELKEYLDTLELSELLEIYYIQLCEINRIRKIILDSTKKNH